MPPSNRITMATKVQPLLSLNPYQNIWKIKVLLTGKGTMRTYNNARGEGCVFNVELTDEAGTQMQATMFNDVARKFFDKFELGKVYYISKGTIKVANKQFRTVENDYEMTLTQYSQVEEAINETMLVGVYLPESVFSHGQLYVALSRGILRGITKVLVKPCKRINRRGVYTSNVVYQEVLRD